MRKFKINIMKYLGLLQAYEEADISYGQLMIYWYYKQSILNGFIYKYKNLLVDIIKSYTSDDKNNVPYGNISLDNFKHTFESIVRNSDHYFQVRSGNGKLEEMDIDPKSEEFSKFIYLIQSDLDCMDLEENDPDKIANNTTKVKISIKNGVETLQKSFESQIRFFEKFPK